MECSSLHSENGFVDEEEEALALYADFVRTIRLYYHDDIVHRWHYR